MPRDDPDLGRLVGRAHHLAQPGPLGPLEAISASSRTAPASSSPGRFCRTSGLDPLVWMSLTLPALAALLDAHAWLSDSLALARPARDRPLMPPSAPSPCRVLP